ncbi:MAG: outer membrane lipoprotein LolB [Hahellaceae bacterium]|nr:outer membrane lipoprotein LolB [Hahellaceae bacterium]MCP5168882.1 outer membrane lipoprotein LolB [Hahellaceae bacterium]
MLWLAACSQISTMPVSHPAQNSQSWDQHAEQLNNLQHWEVSGKIGVKTADASQSAVINRWQQFGEHYEIDLSSSLLGLGNVKLEGTNQFLIIMASGEQPVLSNDPEQLLLEQTHWRLPIKSLPFWVKGLPSPDSPADFTLDSANRLATLSQANWTIRYQDYTVIDNLSLPSKLVITQGSNKITLIIKSWQTLLQL